MTNVKLSPTFPKNKMLEVPIQEQVKRINSEIQEKPVRKKYNESFHSDDIVKPTPHKTIPSDHKLQDQVLKPLITNNVKKNKQKSKLNLESETRRINRSKSKKLDQNQKESRRAKGISPNQKVRARPKKTQKDVMSNEINKAKAQTEQSKIPRKKTFFNKIKAVIKILLATCFGIVLSRFLGWSQKWS
ncbi:hypothetical protein [Lactococcus fujiensis]|nr:hypothetical protein [Lactococcus fujiensis]